MNRAAPRRWLLGPAVVTLAMLVVFVGLGLWQLQRKAEKVALNAALAERAHAAPVALPEPARWAVLRASSDEFRRVGVTARFLPVAPALVFTAGSPLRPDVSGTGYWVFAPARLESGAVVVVNRGFAPEGKQGALVPPDAGAAPEPLMAVLRFPEARGWLTPQDRPDQQRWYTRDPAAMARAQGWGEVAPFYLDLESPMPAGGLPKPGALQVRVRDDHLSYALTWFALAMAVAVAFGVWWCGQRRDRAGDAA